MDSSPEGAAPSAAQARWCVVLAALMWSTSGAFTKVLTLPTSLGLHSPDIDPSVIACLRVLFAGVVLVPFVRRRDLTFRPMMLAMVASFALMNYLFVRAMAEGTSANAIFLQYTAPMWMFLASIWWLGERADQRSFAALAIGLVGIGIIVVGGGTEAQLDVVALGLGSGVAYAGVVICLRVLRDASSRWLTVLNLLVSAAVLAPFVAHLPMPSAAQLAVLFLYGAVQMAIPYWLMARSVRALSPQEAGTITLLEPILNPVWTYLISREVPSSFTCIGGAFILGALVWRYWPTKRGERITNC